MAKYIFSLITLALMLAACGTQQQTISTLDSLLSKTQPTMLFFYTDN